MLSSFILAIVTHPEVQVKGQREIVSVIGRERLPDFNDRPFLPYITAIVKEVLRRVSFQLSFVSGLCFPKMESSCPARFVSVRYALLQLTCGFSGLPHMVTEDDEYNGYFIPAGTLVVGNTW